MGLKVTTFIEDLFIEDLDKSGKNSNRPGLQKILRMIKAREIDFVISQYIDRNYRNGLSLLKFYDKAQEYGTTISLQSKNFIIKSNSQTASKLRYNAGTIFSNLNAKGRFEYQSKQPFA